MLFALLGLTSPNIPANDPRIVYVGRFTQEADGSRSCQWPASEVRLLVRGAKLTARIAEKGDDRWEVVVDGKPNGNLTLDPTKEDYTIGLGSKAKHLVQLVKRTEAFVGTTRFLGFDAPGGQVLRASASGRRIEVVGDSITCGFGNEAENQYVHFQPATENAYMSYASIAARIVGADVTLIAWSGRKMWPDNTMPEIYDRILPTDPGSTFDFGQPPPQAVVINLSTNDFGKANPDEDKWTGAYEAFIRRVWSRYPRAQIYATFGGMISDSYPAERKALTTLRGYMTRMVARIHDGRLHFLEFDVQSAADGYGADWHPSLKTDAKMGARLAEALKRDLKW